ncbi:LysR family transcriptional regulator [Bermanella sp. R86510]|uniref:LysR family transcriptional regulator n=1 Tax=unclassified Bermanella TaxID=2627862 RepID=UPI0037C6C8E9
MLERHHLHILQAVAEYGSLTKAAEHLHLTQSALTHAIKKLETQLNTPVWQKQGRQIQLTQCGYLLLGLANRVIPQFEHIEQLASHMASGEKGTLRIGMECHPCYQWLLKVVAPYLQQWPLVDVDVKQKFQFGGMAALFAHDIDVLVTPDPLSKPGVDFTPVFAYEQVLVMSDQHSLKDKTFVEANDLLDETLITYPVALDRLDIYSQFLSPANCRPKRHKTIETTDIMLQMVASGRGVAALPKWLVSEQYQNLNLRCTSIGEQGIHKSIHLGVREEDKNIEYVEGFLQIAQKTKW